MRQAIIIWIRFIIFFSCTIQAQNFYSKKYNYTNGLDAEQIYYAFQNPTGHLYFATQKGIIIYDGYRFVNFFDKPDKLQAWYYQHPYFYYEDGQGLYQLDTNSIWNQSQLILKKNFTDSNPNNDHFKNLFVDSKNRIWSNDFKYIKYYKNKKLTVFKLPIVGSILHHVQFIEINSATIWIRIGARIFQWKENVQQLEELDFKFNNPSKINQFTKTDTEVVFSFVDGEIIILDLYSYQIKSQFYLPEKEHLIQKIGDLYITSTKIYKKIVKQFNVVFQTKNELINYVYFDSKQNQFWVCTDDGFFQISNPNPSITIYPLHSGLKDNWILSFAQIHSTFYALDQDGNLWEMNNSNWEKMAQLPKNSSPKSLNTIDEQLYICTNTGLFRYENNQLKNMLTKGFESNDEVVKIVQVKPTEVWVLFRNKSIARYSYPSFIPINKAFNHSPDFWLSNTWNDLFLDQNNRVWLLGWMPKGFGINYYHPESDSFVDISLASIGNDKQLFIGDYYFHASQGIQNTLVVSGIGGFNIINAKTQLIKKIDTHQYTFDDSYFNHIVQLLNSDIYVTTQNGLYVYLEDKDKVLKIDKSDGLPQNNVSYGFYKLKDDNLLVGSNDAIIKINTAQLKKGQLTNNLALTQVDINGKKRKFKDNTIILNPKENNVTLEFSNLSFLDANKVYYRYKINNEEWISLDHIPLLQFNSLQPNTYRIVIEAYDQFLNQQKDQLVIKLVVKPTFFQSIGFRILFTLLLLSISFFIFNLIISKRLREEKLKRKIQESKMELLRTQMNPHFIFNTLNSINSYIIQNQTENASSYLTSFSKLMRLILENSRKKYITLEEELKTLKLYLTLEAVRFDHSFDYEFKIENSLDTQKIKVPPLIIQPFAENSIWHGLRHISSRGRLVIKCNLTDPNKLQIQIIDNGIGIAKSKLLNENRIGRKSYGIEITKKRLKMLDKNNSITIEDLYEDENIHRTGTLVTITIQLQTYD